MSFFGGGSSASNDAFAMFSALQQAQSAQQQFQLGSDWLNFAREQFNVGNERQARLDALTTRVTDQQLADMERASGWAQEDRERYKSIFQPLEDKFIERTSNWDSAANQQKAAEEARADVLTNAAAANAANERAMAASGVRPDSGSYAGVSRAQATQTGLASAGAANNARNQLRREAVALQGDAINMGRGLPSQAIDAMRTGGQFGNSASGNALNAEGNWRGNLGIMQTGFQGAGGLYGDAGRAWGGIYGDRVGLLNRQDEMRAQQTGALMGGLGSVVGLGIGMWRSDERVKEHKRPAKGILKAVENMRVERWKYRKGFEDEGEHVGTYAQDFARETGLGDGRNINVVDAIGVTMGAVKELAEEVAELRGRKSNKDDKPPHGKRPKPKSIMRARAA